TAAIEPLVEEGARVAPGLFFDCANQIDRLDVALRVLLYVASDRTPEASVIELTTQHMERSTGFFIKVAVEDLDRVAVPIADDRTAVALGIFLEITRNAAKDVIQILVVSQVGLAPDALEVRCKPFVEPRLRPVAAGEQVAEPLVGE